MDPRIYELLNGIPENADYAAEAGDLDVEDIPQDRLDSVKELLRESNDELVRFYAAKLLTSWGAREGLVALEEFMSKPEVFERLYVHRLHGYDDTYRHILMAVTMYFANVADKEGKEVARVQVCDLLLKIVALAGVRPFEISEMLRFVRRENYIEYLAPLKQYLLSIIDHPEVHRWKIYDALEFFMTFDSEFVVSLLKSKNMSIDDFSPPPLSQS
ncbi:MULTISPECIES: hypothetical protein [unclassified Pseudomonas]|uniref:hypothetical protein n=1 Tax=unclassified Pseudomonas TaxID=196821 RepID=UPI000A1EB52E|nr:MULTISPECIES: hypothetical protein [unclassified Pseudomonas]